MMKGIILKILVVLLLVFFCDRIIGYTLIYIFNRTLSGESGGNVNYMLTKKQDVDFLIFGSSRAKHQINPDQLKALNGNGYNAGVNGFGSVVYNSILLDLVTSKNIKPKDLLVQIDAISFIPNKDNHTKELIPLYPFYNQSKLLRSYCHEMGYEEKIKLNSILYRFNGKAINLAFNYLKRNQVVDNNGYEPLSGTVDTLKEHILPYKDIKINKLDAFKLKALDNIIDICKNTGINLYFIMPPSYNNSEYSVLLNNLLINYIQSKTVGRIINMSNVDNYPLLQSPSKWKDRNHFSSYGAELFSTYLNDSLSKYQFINQSLSKNSAN